MCHRIEATVDQLYRDCYFSTSYWYIARIGQIQQHVGDIELDDWCIVHVQTWETHICPAWDGAEVGCDGVSLYIFDVNILVLIA